MTNDELIAALEAKAIPEPNSGCLIWLGAISRARGNMGYGSIKLNGRHERAHRAMYAAHFGDVPAGKVVCHRCDNPLCISPQHMFLGSPADNNKDRRKKMRDHWFRRPRLAQEQLAIARSLKRPEHVTVGERNGKPKLTDDGVRQIRLLAKGRVSQSKIAARFGISQSVVSGVINGTRWSHVNDA